MDIVVVRVLIEDSYKKRKFNGTAFFINSTTLITAKHVLEKYMNHNYKIYLSEIPHGGSLLISTDFIRLCKRDIAIIYLKKEFDIPIVLFSKKIEVGLDIELVGYHNSDGAINRYKHNISGYINAKHTYEIQDSRTGGLSGSPILLDGKICGIAQAINRDKGVTYIIPISECCDNSIFDIIDKKVLKNPYRGLSSFGYKDRINYYGREKESYEIANILKNSKLFTLLGASGSGKSSLIFAGILPLIVDDGIKILSFRPLSEVFKNLAWLFIPTLYHDKLEQIEQSRKLTDKLMSFDIKLDSLVEVFLRDSGAEHLYIIIDQFEELFTLNSEKNIEKHFINQLLTIINSQLNVTLFISIRADFLYRISSYELFNEAYNKNPSQMLSLLSHVNLKRVIEEPVKRVGVEFQDGLVDRIINEIEDEAGQLPLLQFALEQLWKKREGRVITHTILDEMRSISHSISYYANRVYSQQNLQKQLSIKKVFIKLINPTSSTDYTRRIAFFNEFAKEEIDTIFLLANKRLVVTKDNSVDIVHEALIREWELLKRWIDEYREFLIWEKRLRDDRGIYEKSGDLLVDSKLLEAKSFLKTHEEYISSLDIEFIRKSISNAIQKRNKKIAKSSFITLLLVGAIIYALLGWNQARKYQDNFVLALKGSVDGMISMLYSEKNRKIKESFDYIIEKFDSSKDEEVLRIVHKAYFGKAVFYDKENQQQKTIELYNLFLEKIENYKENEDIIEYYVYALERKAYLLVYRDNIESVKIYNFLINRFQNSENSVIKNSIKKLYAPWSWVNLLEGNFEIIIQHKKEFENDKEAEINLAHSYLCLGQKKESLDIYRRYKRGEEQMIFGDFDKFRTFKNCNKGLSYIEEIKVLLKSD